MKVLVTGATGFVGSYAVPELLAAGHSVRLMVRDGAKAERVLTPRGVDLHDPRVELVDGDMTDHAATAAAIDGCDAVLHAAASVAVTHADPELTVSVNVDGTRNVVAAAARAGLDPVVHVSTTGVFVPPHDPVITVDSPLAEPRNAYGRSKKEAELIARGLQAEGLPVTIVYPGGVMGPDQPTLDAFVEGVAGALNSAWPMPKAGVTVIDVRDLAKILAATFESGQGPRRFMAGGRYFSWRRLADLIDELTGVACTRMVVPGWVMVSLGQALDWAKRVRPFHYPLTTDAAEYMCRMVPTDDGPTLAALGVEYRPTAETLEESLRWLAAEGHLKRSAAGRLAPPQA